MLKRSFLILALLIFFIIIGIVGANESIMICHIPHNNIDGAHTIVVDSRQSADNHIANHGDTEGVCPSDATEQATEAPTDEASVEPSAEPTDEAAVESTEEPTDEAAVESTEEPTDEASVEPSAEPTDEASAESVSEVSDSQPSSQANTSQGRGATNQSNGRSDTNNTSQDEPGCQGLENALNSMPANAQGRAAVERQFVNHGCISDTDGDGIEDDLDNCPLTPNADQFDYDNDGVGNVCDDSDDDGIFDSDDNCIWIPNSDQADSDNNGIGDECQDLDGDNLPDIYDNCPLTYNPDQADGDSDGLGDVCDDSDNDGIFDSDDECPTSPNNLSDSNGYGDSSPSNVYYVALNGDNRNDGSMFYPFRTFEHAMSILTAGDELRICEGTYSESLEVPETTNGASGADITIRAVAGHDVALDMGFQSTRAILVMGDYINVIDVEARNSDHSCVHAQGNYVDFSELVVHDCNLHGVLFTAMYGSLSDSEVYAVSLNNQENPGSVSWQSGVKVQAGEHITISGNLVHENYGEGIAVRGRNILVNGNTAYDNFSANIYVDNTSNAVVDGNLAYSTGNPAFFRDGRGQTCFLLAEEYYEGWGANLQNLVMTNNIAVACHHNLHYWGGDDGVENQGLKGGLIANNLFWGSTDRGIRFVERAATTNVRIYNNIVQQDNGRLAYFEGTTGITTDYNFWVGILDSNSLVNAAGTNDLSGDVRLAGIPSFDPSSFSLAGDSPAINAGTAEAGLSHDFFGNARDSQIDMGPIEYAG